MIYRALFLLCLCFHSAPSFASEVLNFKKPSGYKEKLVTAFLNEQGETDSALYLIAKTDLNNDAINEYIAKPAAPSACKTLGFCPHYVVAVAKYKPMLLGVFEAHNIIIENDHLYGVRHLRLYNHPNNNFTYTSAQWNPFASKYEIKEK